jgi:aryl-alcohol dehydrogenase-like predicted oxidoreductase
MGRKSSQFAYSRLSPEEIGEVNRTLWAGSPNTILELAFAWLLSKGPVSSVIAGASRPEQVWANVAAAQWKLSPEDVAEVDAIL